MCTVQDLGTDNPGGDYYYQGVKNKLLSFLNGQPQTVTVLIKDLHLTSGSESIRLIVQTLSGQLATTYLASTIFTINNTDSLPGTFSFSPNTPQVSESRGTEQFTLTRTDTTEPATVYVSTLPGQTGNPGGNTYYDGLLNLPVTFSAGQANATVDVNIKDLGLTTGSETFGLIAQSDPTQPITDTPRGILHDLER